MVPTYSPGLPMVMAAFKALGAPDAVFYVVPLLGALIICRRNRRDRRCGVGYVDGSGRLSGACG